VRRRAPLATAPEGVLPPYACGHPRDPDRIEAGGDDRCYLCRRLDGSAVTREQLLATVTPGQRDQLAVETGTARKYRWGRRTAGDRPAVDCSRTRESGEPG